MQQQAVNLFDWENGIFRPGKLAWDKGRIVAFDPLPDGEGLPYALPGLVDAHVHIESSMLLPAAFARLAVVHGTVATVSDPHEIANVMGTAGVHFMIANSRKVPFKCFFGAPSCVPATSFETAGAEIGPGEIRELLENPDIWYLAEMMNWPGVLYTDAGVMEKIAHAKALGKPIDGHAPGLTGEQARQYFSTGIATDHECYQLEEAMGKAALGVKILIREGSAARNFNTLLPLFHHYPDQLMFCSDDKHPDDLLLGHINTLVQRALAAGHDFVKVWKAASVNPVLHYRLPVGLLRVGDPADFLLIDQPTQHFKVLQTVIEGQVVAENGRTLLPEISDQPINCFLATPKKTEDFRYAAHAGELPVMVAIDRELITRGDRIACPPGSWVEADPAANLLKITVVNRYADKAPAVAFIRNFGLQKGALASSVAHDSHNIIAVGTDDHALALAVNAVIEDQGGIAATDGEQVLRLPLPVAGLMSVESGETVAAQYTALHQFAKNVLGSPLSAPFMTLSFMALLVIPRYKLSDKGLFDGESFTFVKVNQEKP